MKLYILLIAALMLSACEFPKRFGTQLSEEQIKKYSQKCVEIGGTPQVMYWRTDELIGKARSVYCSGI